MKISELPYGSEVRIRAGRQPHIVLGRHAYAGALGVIAPAPSPDSIGGAMLTPEGRPAILLPGVKPDEFWAQDMAAGMATAPMLDDADKLWEPTGRIVPAPILDRKMLEEYRAAGAVIAYRGGWSWWRELDAGTAFGHGRSASVRKDYFALFPGVVLDDGRAVKAELQEALNAAAPNPQTPEPAQDNEPSAVDVGVIRRAMDAVFDEPDVNEGPETPRFFLRVTIETDSVEGYKEALRALGEGL